MNTKLTTCITVSSLVAAASVSAALATAPASPIVEMWRASATEIVHGQIEGVADDFSEFTVRVQGEPEFGDEETMTLKVNNTTQFRLDGKEATKEEALKVDRRATASHEDGVAISVDVRSMKSPS